MNTPLKTLKGFLIEPSGAQSSGSYQFDHWEVQLGSQPREDTAKMASLHEMYHGQLNDTTAYGTLLHVISVLRQEHKESEHYNHLLETLVDFTTRTHEVFATYSSMFVVHRGLPQQKLIEPYGEAYIGYFQTAEYFANTLSNPLLGYQLFHAVVRACMQVSCLDKFIALTPPNWDAQLLSEHDKPDFRLSFFEDDKFLRYIKNQLKRLISKKIQDIHFLNGYVTRFF